MKNAIIAILVIIIIGGGLVWYMERMQGAAPAATQTETTAQAPTSTQEAAAAATTTSAAQPQEVIGKSVEGRDIVAYHFGSGSTEILVVAGIHGGYEWNTVLLANDLVSFLQSTPSAVPSGEMVTVIPLLNPDGLSKVTDNPTSFTAANITASKPEQIAGRYNADGVDLNRNFDCDWQSKGVWQTTPVSGGSAPFSEPESQALKTYVTSHHIAAAIVYYSAAGGVYASNCHNGVLPATDALVTAYANASGYPSHESFDFYAVTGDAVNWLAKENIPAISVLLTNHTDAEWNKNSKGILAALAQYSK